MSILNELLNKCANKNCDQVTNLKCCAKCKTIRYCSKKCQVNSWKIHKFLCNEIIKGNAKDEIIIKNQKINGSDTMSLLNFISENLFDDILEKILIEEKYCKAFVYSKQLGLGYYLTNEDSNWCRMIPKGLIDGMKKDELKNDGYHRCADQRIVCALDESDKSIATYLCACFV
jgi:hypothetical protein